MISEVNNYLPTLSVCRKKASDAPVISCYHLDNNINMGKDLVDLTFFKDSEEPWGFRLAGGKDFGQPLSISQVS